MNTDYGWSILKTCLATAFFIMVVQGWAQHDAEIKVLRETLKLHGIDVPVKTAAR